MHTINLFISHSWAYSHHYTTLSSWIFDENWSSGNTQITFLNTSVPKDNPIHNAPNEATLRQAIFTRIAQAHVVVIPTGMYASYSKWIGKEIEGAKVYQKPVVAVNPWAQEKKSSIVQNAASEIVGWTKKSVVNAIWRNSPYG